MARAQKTVSIRLEADDYQFLSSLAEAENEDLSSAVRDLIGRGRVFLGLERYRRGEVSLSKAAELAGVAVAVRDLLRRLRAVLGDVPYNVVVNTAPSGDERPFHWWLDIVPRLSVTAGFEHATGQSVCTVAPEAAAAALRDET